MSALAWFLMIGAGLLAGAVMTWAAARLGDSVAGYLTATGAHRGHHGGRLIAMGKTSIKRFLMLVTVCVVASAAKRDVLTVAGVASGGEQFHVPIPAGVSTNCTRLTCSSIANPAREITWWDIWNDVDTADGTRYRITCRFAGDATKCFRVVAGSVYQAEIQGNTLWLFTQIGGNRTKVLRVKMQIVNASKVSAAVE